MSHINLQLKQVMDVLERELRSMTPEEIGQMTKFDVRNNEMLMRNIRQNPKVKLEIDGRWRWKSKYNIRNKDELLTFLRTSYSGVLRTDLYDCYKEAANDVKAIIEADDPREVILIKDSTNKKELLFPFEPSLFLKISGDVKEKWEKIRAPDRIEIHRYLIGRKLKSGELGDLPPVQVNRKRPGQQKARKARRIKLSNTHMEGTGIDLRGEGSSKNTAFNE